MGILNLRQNADEWRDITEARMRTLMNEMLYKMNSSIEVHLADAEKRMRAVIHDTLNDVDKRVQTRVEDVEARLARMELRVGRKE